MPAPSSIQLRGARAHNLRGVDLDLPRGAWTAVVGVSGSGKTSLVFDTLVREGQRRFLSAWAPRARLRLGKLGDPAVDALRGLPTPLALGVDKLGRHARSTVGTATGLLDLLRLWWARDGQPGPLTRAELSFNRDGACPSCRGLGVQDEVAEDLLVADATRSIRAGALRPTLPNGYTVYSQVTVDVMDTIARAHGFTVDTPWNELTDAQRQVVWYGTDALVVPFGKHSIESRLKWQGITAKPREEGHYRGIIPVIRETLKRSRNDNILKYTRSVPCEACHGTRLGPRARAQHIDGVALVDLLHAPLQRLTERLRGLSTPVGSVVRPQLLSALAQATELGLGHLSLGRSTPTLSDGEHQRCRLLSQLGLRLGGLLLAFDEPTLGLHPSAQPGLARALRRLVDQGNTLLVVEHDPRFVGASDRWLAIGPGAGPDGGQVVAHGPTPPNPLGTPTPPPSKRLGTGALHLTGARKHNLHTDLELRHGALNVVIGPSGAGKSTLVFQTLLPALQGRKAPGVELTGRGDRSVQWLDASPLGRTPRSTPATYTGLFDRVRKRFAKTPEAKAAGLTASHFSHNHKAGRCPHCEGLGVVRIGLHLVDDVERPCPVCGGGRYRPEVLDVRVGGLSIADVLGRTAPELLASLGDDAATSAMLQALIALGLGHLQLGRSTTTLSRGEAQRVKLATVLGKPVDRPQVLLLDEPDRGLHPTDLSRLLAGLHALADAGHTVVAISHHQELWHAADHLVEVREGVARALDAVPDTPRLPTPPPAPPPPSHIVLTGVRTHNLKGVDVGLPHRALTVVTGPSGSGKSSLVFDTLAAEAQRRYAETLPFTVRRELRALPRPVLDEARGLTPTLSLRQGRAADAATGSVATVAGIEAPLRLLWARLGTVDDAAAGLPAEAFSRRSPRWRCPVCEGRRRARRVSAERLIDDPSRSLWGGAARGTVAGRFFTEAGDRHLALLGAAAGEAVLHTPWRDLSDAQRRVALDGAGPEPIELTWAFQRGKRTGSHVLNEPWRGLIALVEEEAPRRARRAGGEAWWDVFDDVPCAACDGTGLRDPARRTRLGGERISVHLDRTVSSARAWLDAMRAEVEGTPAADVWRRLGRDLSPVLDDLVDLGLGSVSLDQAVATLSPSERQRLHLSEVLHGDLVGLTVVLDEPGAGLTPPELDRLTARLRALVDAGQTVIVVSHRTRLRDAADHVVALGPGAGPDGGQIVAEGPPDEVPWPTEALPSLPPSRDPHPRYPSWPAAGLIVVDATESLPDDLHPIGPPGAQQTVLTAMGLLPKLQSLFHAAQVGEQALPKRAFSFHSPAGRCPTCKGTGRERVSLDILADLELPCPTCHGGRYRAEVLEVRWAGRTIADTLQAPSGSLPLADTPLGAGQAVLRDLSLGHLPLGAPVKHLSGGEARRLGLAAAWSVAPKAGRAWFVERPDEGLHHVDLARLVGALRQRVDGGELVVMTCERPTLRAVAGSP